MTVLSAASLGLAAVAAVLLGTWERASADLRMRGRRLLTIDRERIRRPDITVLSIDPETQAALGRYGAGQWLSRKPFADQLLFFENYFRPTVLVHDILFQDVTGRDAPMSVTEDSARLREIVDQLQRILGDRSATVPSETLLDMNRLAAEQGDAILAHRLASVAEQGAFHCVLACYFRGGGLEDQSAPIPAWSDEDVFGGDPSGDEDKGCRIPYLRDVEIPGEDIVFPGPKGDRRYGYSHNALLPGRDLLDYGLLGYLNCRADRDSVVRRLPVVWGFRYRNSVTGQERKVFVPALSLMASLLHLGVRFPLQRGTVRVRFGDAVTFRTPGGGVYRIPIDEFGRMYLNYEARFEDFRAVSFAQVAPSPREVPRPRRDEIASRLKRQIDGSIVVVGLNTAGMDIGACPLSPQTPLMVAHLTAINNILRQRFLAPLGRGGTAALIGVLFVFMTGVCYGVRTSKLGPTGVGLGAGYAAVAYLGVHFNWVILPLILPVTYIAVCSFLVLSFRFLTEERARRRIRGMFSTMVSAEVLNYLEENPESFSLKGHNVDATVFFSDIADFTGMSEHLTPEHLTELMNRYLTPVTNCIMGWGGYVDKYVGDAIMAVWGAPYPRADHAVNACLSALEQQRIVEDLNERVFPAYGLRMRVRMGIHSGWVTAGNMGSERKLQYTVMGDVVNLASRLEPANKDFGTRVIVGDATRERVKERFITRPLARIRLAGKQNSVLIHELLGERGLVTEAEREMAALYEAALEQFHLRRWGPCVDLLDRILARRSDPASVVLRERAQQCRAHPPGEDWQGEYVRAEKR